MAKLDSVKVVRGEKEYTFSAWTFRDSTKFDGRVQVAIQTNDFEVFLDILKYKLQDTNIPNFSFQPATVFAGMYRGGLTEEQVETLGEDGLVATMEYWKVAKGLTENEKKV